MRDRVPAAGARKPLGLVPIGDDDKPAAAPAFVSSGVPSVAAGLGAETLARAASMADVAEALDAAVAINLDGDAALGARIRELRSDNARLETELARLRAQFAEAKAEFAEAKHILERLQITREGKRGERGPCGADGAPGPRGERGAKGDPGKAAPTITAWAIDADNFTAAPILADGSTGATLRLRPLFESFNDQINADDDAREADAAASSRAASERQAELARQGLPAR